MRKGEEENRRKEERSEAIPAEAWGQLTKESGFGAACTECGMTTSNWCDGGTYRGNDCVAGDIASDRRGNTQNTALCTNCDHRYGKCHLCRRVALCTPPEWSGVKEPERKREATEKMLRLKEQEQNKEGQEEGTRAQKCEHKWRASKAAKCACGEDRAACGECGRGWAQQDGQAASSGWRIVVRQDLISECKAKKKKEAGGGEGNVSGNNK